MCLKANSIVSMKTVCTLYTATHFDQLMPIHLFIG